VVIVGARGSVVGYDTALWYMAEGRGFVSRCHWIFQLTSSFQPHYGPEVDSASDRNEYQESSCGVGGRPARKADNLTAICERIV
jgi:hypothetical protein